MIVPDNKVTVKGVKASVAQKVFFDDYEFCLSSLSPKPVDIRRIGSDLHRMFTYSAENIGLSTFDIKSDNGISTYVFGHWKTEFYIQRLEQFQIIR